MNTNSLLPTPPALSGYTWQPARPQDAPAIYQLLLDVDKHDDRHWAGTLAEVERDFKDPSVNPETDTLLGFAPDGRAAALIWLFAPPDAEREHRVFLFPDVHPEHRQPAILDFVLAWAETRARQILDDRADRLPRLMRSSALEKDQRRIAWFQERGFAINRYFYEMRRDLAQPIASPDLPAGPEARELDACARPRCIRGFQRILPRPLGLRASA